MLAAGCFGPTAPGISIATMSLPLEPPIEPQLARGKPELPVGEGWLYEPKYDGFRAIAFVDGDELFLQSRGSKPLERYFPELRFPPGRYVLDGEIVIDAEPGASETEDFDALSQRIHPAASRIELLSEQTPARYVAFDLLALEDEVAARPAVLPSAAAGSSSWHCRTSRWRRSWPNRRRPSRGSDQLRVSSRRTPAPPTPPASARRW